MIPVINFINLFSRKQNKNKDCSQPDPPTNLCQPELLILSRRRRLVMAVQLEMSGGFPPSHKIVAVLGPLSTDIYAT